jgi:hypothetical protein
MDNFEMIEDAIILGVDGKFLGETKTVELLSEITGMKARCYDHYIDNGCRDDEEDDYVKCAAFDFENSDITVNIYYGDNTLEIGYVEVYE